MPLLDHFHPPLSDERHWESFHSAWAGEIMAYLNGGILPSGYFAETQVHFGGRIEVDVASFERVHPAGLSPQRNGGVAVQSEPATQVMSMPAVFPDELEVRIVQRSGGPTLVGAIELTSPSNKDRPEARRAFAAKCAAYLHEGVGLVIVDLVSDRRFNLHDELIHLLQQDDAYCMEAAAHLYAVAYRPFRDPAEGDRIEMRPYRHRRAGLAHRSAGVAQRPDH
jgi:hypothetical protein